MNTENTEYKKNTEHTVNTENTEHRIQVKYRTYGVVHRKYRIQNRSKIQKLLCAHTLVFTARGDLQ